MMAMNHKGEQRRSVHCSGKNQTWHVIWRGLNEAPFTVCSLAQILLSIPAAYNKDSTYNFGKDLTAWKGHL
jgi:hypothetical protein